MAVHGTKGGSLGDARQFKPGAPSTDRAGRLLRPVGDAERAPGALLVRRRELGPHFVEVFAEHVRKSVGNGDHPRFATLADERDPSSVKIDLLGTQKRWS
jgi:hypothetical protein